MSGDDQSIQYIYHPGDPDPGDPERDEPSTGLRAGAVALGDFMENLGGIIDPTRKRPKITWAKVFIPRGYLSVVRIFSIVVWEEKRPDRPVSKLGRRIRLGLSQAIYAGALLAIGFLGVTLVPGRSDPLPRDLVGVWQTTAPDYADRTFEIAEDALVFRTGPRPSDYEVHLISEVRSSSLDDDVKLYRVTYGAEDAGGELAFHYHPRPQPQIRFAHQRDMIWTRR